VVLLTHQVAQRSPIYFGLLPEMSQLIGLLPAAGEVNVPGGTSCCSRLISGVDGFSMLSFDLLFYEPYTALIRLQLVLARPRRCW
jgi:hypothetical protein